MCDRGDVQTFVSDSLKLPTTLIVVKASTWTDVSIYLGYLVPLHASIECPISFM